MVEISDVRKSKGGDIRVLVWPFRANVTIIWFQQKNWKIGANSQRVDVDIFLRQSTTR